MTLADTGVLVSYTINNNAILGDYMLFHSYNNTPVNIVWNSLQAVDGSLSNPTVSLTSGEGSIKFVCVLGSPSPRRWVTVSVVGQWKLNGVLYSSLVKQSDTNIVSPLERQPLVYTAGKWTNVPSQFYGGGILSGNWLCSLLTTPNSGQFFFDGLNTFKIHNTDSNGVNYNNVLSSIQFGYLSRFHFYNFSTGLVLPIQSVSTPTLSGNVYTFTIETIPGPPPFSVGFNYVIQLQNSILDSPTIMTFNSDGNISNNNFFRVAYGANNTENRCQFMATGNRLITNFRALCSVSPGTSLTLTIRKNGVATSGVLSIINPSVSASGIFNIPLVAGDLISIQASLIGSSSNVILSMEW